MLESVIVFIGDILNVGAGKLISAHIGNKPASKINLSPYVCMWIEPHPYFIKEAVFEFGIDIE